METKYRAFTWGLLMPLVMAFPQTDPGKCMDYGLKNDFKNIRISICGNKMIYYEKDYDVGPFKDTCVVKFSRRRIKIVQSATNMFWYKRIYYGKDKKSVFLVFRESFLKPGKLEIPLVSD
jgi:hypothetical protein